MLIRVCLPSLITIATDYLFENGQTATAVKRWYCTIHAQIMQIISLLPCYWYRCVSINGPLSGSKSVHCTIAVYKEVPEIFIGPSFSNLHIYYPLECK